MMVRSCARWAFSRWRRRLFASRFAPAVSNSCCATSYAEIAACEATVASLDDAVLATNSPSTLASSVSASASVARTLFMAVSMLFSIVLMSVSNASTKSAWLRSTPRPSAVMRFACILFAPRPMLVVVSLDDMIAAMRERSSATRFFSMVCAVCSSSLAASAASRVALTDDTWLPTLESVAEATVAASAGAILAPKREVLAVYLAFLAVVSASCSTSSLLTMLVMISSMALAKSETPPTAPILVPMAMAVVASGSALSSASLAVSVASTARTSSTLACDVAVKTMAAARSARAVVILIIAAKRRMASRTSIPEAWSHTSCSALRVSCLAVTAAS
mmetsp:Transcript_45408/g.108360  ORF Transcript_45408/g.108360 Transcript_45408/m.108360 type:complete len:334 (-) Transcript_45408:726-1727(-)